MSLYKENEALASVYHIDDSDSTKTSSYPATADFTIKMFIIRRNEDTIAILGQEAGEYVANVNGKYTNASAFEKSDKVVWNSGTYIVTNTPKYNQLFDVYHLVLRRQI
jgi:hypothetical protein